MHKPNVWAVIPAAGESRRFKDEGFDEPKPLLTIKHKERTKRMIEWVFDSLPSAIDGVLVGYEDKLHTYPLTVSGPVALKIPIENSKGQADTIQQMVGWVCGTQKYDDVCLVLNCDVIFTSIDLGRILTAMHSGFDMVIGVQRTHNEAMSFIDTYPVPKLFVEKKPISNWGMSGAWAFRSSVKLLRALQSLKREDGVEPYLSQALNYYQGSRYALELNPDNILDWGTPAAVRASGAEIVR